MCVFLFSLLISPLVLARKGGLETSPLKTKSVEFIPNSFKADFEQSFVGVLTGRPKKSSGELKYLKPGNFYFEIKEPKRDRTTFMTNFESGKSWQFNPSFDPSEKGEVNIRSSNQLPLAKFFDALSGGLDSNSHFKVNDLSGANSKILKLELVFNEIAKKEFQIEKALLIFQEGESVQRRLDYVRQLELTYLDQKKVTLTFNKIKLNPSLKSADFVFNIQHDLMRVIEH